MSCKKNRALRRPGCSADTEGFRWLAGAEKPSYADVSSLADAAAELPVTSPLTEGIMDIVNAADDWLEAARKTVAKRNSGQKLGKCLQWMLASLDRALEQFTLRLQVPRDVPSFLDQDICHRVEWPSEPMETCMNCILVPLLACAYCRACRMGRKAMFRRTVSSGGL